MGKKAEDVAFEIGREFLLAVLGAVLVVLLFFPLLWLWSEFHHLSWVDVHDVGAGLVLVTEPVFAGVFYFFGFMAIVLTEKYAGRSNKFTEVIIVAVTPAALVFLVLNSSLTTRWAYPGAGLLLFLIGLVLITIRQNWRGQH